MTHINVHFFQYHFASHKICHTCFRKANEDFNEASGLLKAAVKQVQECQKTIKMAKEDFKNKQSQFLVAEKRVRTIKSEIATLKAAIEKNDNR